MAFNEKKEQDFQEEKANKGNRKKDYKKGRGAKQKDAEPKVNISDKYRPDRSGVAAVSVMESKGLMNDNNIPVKAYPLATLHSAVDFEYMFTRTLQNHRGEIRRVIKKRASLYYSILSPTTISDIEDKLAAIVKYSLKTFAYITYAWKIQNAANVEDEDGYNLIQALAGDYFLRGVAGTLTLSNAKVQCLWSVSNAAWKRDILEKLKHIYLTDKAKEFIYTTIGHFIQFDYGDESSVRLWDLKPHGLSVGVEGSPLTYDGFKAELDSYEEDIDACFNAYPFMEEILQDLRLTAPGDHYDFTRDLAATKLNVLVDRDHALENLCYMVTTNRLSPSITDIPPRYRLVTANVPSVVLEYYHSKDDPKEGAAKGMIYLNRIFINTVNYSNALRFAVEDTSISFLEKSTTSGVKTSICISPKPIFIAATGLTVSGDNINALTTICLVNYYHNQLDMPNDAMYNVLLSDATFTAEGLVVTSPTMINAQGGDYIIDVNDIESVVSDACAMLCIDVVDAPVISQTLGNAGNN